MLCARLPLAADKLLVTAGPNENEVAMEHRKLNGLFTSAGLGLSSGETERRVSAASSISKSPLRLVRFLRLATNFALFDAFRFLLRTFFGLMFG